MPETNAVYLYLATPDNPALQYTGCLDATEQTRATRLRFAHDRLLYVAAHVFLRQTLSRHAAIAPEAWRFGTNAWGKPFIVNPEGAGLHFNLSHTHGLVACAISQTHALGVDVETIRLVGQLHALSASVLQDTEQALVAVAGHPQQQTEQFFTLWTLKEAYIKAVGKGLSMPLQQFAFTLEQDVWQLQGEQGNPGADWAFLSMAIGSSHQLALAVNTGPGVTLAVHLNSPPPSACSSTVNTIPAPCQYRPEIRPLT